MLFKWILIRLNFHSKIIAFTRCGVGLGSTSLQNTITNLTAQNASKAVAAASSSVLSINPQFLLNDTSNDSWIPISNLSKLSFVCLGSTADSYFQNSLELYQQFLDMSGQKGQLFIAHIESEANKVNKHTYNNGDGITLPTAAQWKNDIIPHTVEEVCEINYKPFEAVLNCGEYHKLESSITIWPSPMVGY